MQASSTKSQNRDAMCHVGKLGNMKTGITFIKKKDTGEDNSLNGTRKGIHSIKRNSLCVNSLCLIEA